MAPGALSSLNPELLLLAPGCGKGGGGGALTLLLVHCWGRLGPLPRPCLCYCNQRPADTQPLGLRDAPSDRCSVGRIHH